MIETFFVVLTFFVTFLPFTFVVTVETIVAVSEQTAVFLGAESDLPLTKQPPEAFHVIFEPDGVLISLARGVDPPFFIFF